MCDDETKKQLKLLLDTWPKFVEDIMEYVDVSKKAILRLDDRLEEVEITQHRHLMDHFAAICDEDDMPETFED